MAKTKKIQNPTTSPGTCMTCEHSYNQHEISFATKKPFLCKCRLLRNEKGTTPLAREGRSFFLDKPCETGGYRKKKEA